MFDFEKINSTLYYYQPNYTMPTLNNNYTQQYLSAPIVYKPGSATFTFAYEDQGLSHSESWYFIGQNVTEGWTVFYYCGSASGWDYEGGLVAAKNKTLSSESLKVIEGIVNKNGLDFSSWCLIDNELDGYGCGTD